MILRRRCVRAAHELSSCSRARVIMPLRAKITNPAMFSAQVRFVVVHLDCAGN
jgi:hypothetical protein